MSKIAATLKGVIPEADIATFLEDPALVGGFPTQDDITRCYLDGNGQYQADHLEASWEEAADALNVEREALESASDATSWSLFEDQLDEALADVDPAYLCGLETGVASAVLALSAAGCVTTTSCRGHQGFASLGGEVSRGCGSTAMSRAVALRDLAASADCGFSAGLVCEVWARNLSAILTFAAAVIEARHQFAHMPRHGLQAAPGD